MVVGLISDTHGLIRPEALKALASVEVILHAGDVGGTAVLDALAAIAPVQAVHGNTDAPDSLPAAIDCVLAGVSIHVSHGHEVGRPSPARMAALYHADVIVFGHTHRSVVAQVGRSLVVNPGAAGPRRFDVRPSVAVLELPDLYVTVIDLVR
jgi:uncharacterized protein